MEVTVSTPIEVAALALYAADDALAAAQARPTLPAHRCRNARTIRCSACGQALVKAEERSKRAETALLKAVRDARPRR